MLQCEQRTANSEQRTANSEQPNHFPKLRILYIAHYNSLGGGANLALLHMMLDMKKRHNVEPCVLMPAEGELAEKCRENNIQVFCSKFYLWSYAKNIKVRLKGAVKYLLNKFYFYRKALSLLKTQHFDIIHSNSSVINIGDFLSRRLKFPHVWHIREYGIEDYGLYYILPASSVRSTYSRTSRVITISNSLYNNYVNQKKLCSAYNTVCVPNGLTLTDEYLKTYMQNGRVNFCITGMLFSGKNQLIAIKACAKLKALTPNFMLHIIGTGGQPYTSELEEAVKISGLQDNVKFWGFRYDVNEILKTMDVGLMLSRCEAFGRVTVEYMLNYMPVIGVNTGATPEIVQDNETGFICNLDDVDKLAELMHKFITHTELLEKIGNKGRERAVKNFSIERNTDEIYALYQEILSR